MRWHTVDYLKQEGARTRGVLDRGFWLHGVPRLIVLCRLFGHRPVVDGIRWATADRGRSSDRTRWVVCRRCGIRPQPQGHLDPDQWAIGDVYDGVCRRSRDAAAMTGAYSHPGPWPESPRGSLGGQLVIGRGSGVVGADVKVGNQGSEQVLAASIKLGNLASLYVHSEDHGTWLQRVLNPVGFNSRVVKIAIGDGQLRWRLWASRDLYQDPKLPRWREGSIAVDPRDILWGRRRHDYVDVGEPVSVTVRMPHGDDHIVRLQLQKVRTGRPRGRKTQSWSVDWECNPGIPTRLDGHGRYGAAHVDVTDAAVGQGVWAAEAAAAIAAQMTHHRARARYPILQLVQAG